MLAPHVSKSVKPSDIFDYEKIQSGIEITPEEEFENFDKMFMDNEKKKQKDREKIVSELKRINAKAEEEKRNGISN